MAASGGREISLGGRGVRTRKRESRDKVVNTKRGEDANSLARAPGAN